VRIFEYQRAVLHAKTLVADDYVTLVWSSNLDFRCFHFNAECNVVILDDEIGRRMAHAFETDLPGSVEIVRGMRRQWLPGPMRFRHNRDPAANLAPRFSPRGYRWCKMTE
jgi:phosphatidylserine/phosphatidylglycerophosphate/cardiolipin synthase-like enzyme